MITPLFGIWYSGVHKRKTKPNDSDSGNDPNKTGGTMFFKCPVCCVFLDFGLIVQCKIED
jgi:hypothetical protein